jgi:hypothetical protein
MRKQSIFTGSKGYYPSQPFIQTGIVDTVFAGENCIQDPEGWRVFGGWEDQSENRTPATLGYTATLTAGNKIATLSGGATALTDFRARQHVLIGRKEFLIERILSDTSLRLSPTPTADEAGSGQTIQKVLVLSALNNERSTQYAGNAVLHRSNAIFSIGDGALHKSGAALSASLTASESLKVAYPIPGGTYDSRPAGFSAPSAPTVAEGSTGTKNMPVGSYPIVLVRKRIGFSGNGNPSPRAIAVLTAVNKTVAVTLPAFATSEGQTGWIIGGPRPSEVGQNTPGVWEWTETDQESTTIEVEVYDDEVQTRLSFDNDLPPKGGFVFTLANYIVVASTGGAPDSSDIETTPGPELAPGKYNNPEAFSPFARVPVAGGEEILGVQVGQMVAFLMTPNTMQVASLSGSQVAPLVVRKYWEYGFLHQFNATVAHDQFIAMTDNGLHRTADGNSFTPVDDFSVPVRSDLRDTKLARCFVGYDPSREHIVVFHANDRLNNTYWQTKAWSYNLKTRTWNPPAYLGSGSDFTVTSCRTVGGKLYYTTADGKIYRWDEGLQTLTGYLGPPFSAEAAHFQRTVRSAKVTGNLSALKLYQDLNATGLRTGATAPTKTFTPTGASTHQPIWLQNTQCYSFTYRMEFSASNKARVFDQLEVEYVLHTGFRK